MRAKFAIVVDTSEVLCIQDTGSAMGCMSVTNDAEAVVEKLAGRLRGRRLEYYDSEGCRDQLLVKDGKFAGFAPPMNP